VKGDQVFTFPEGFRLGKGKTVTITQALRHTRIRQVCSNGLPLPYGTMMEIQRNYWTTRVGWLAHYLEKSLGNFTDGISWLILNS